MRSISLISPCQRFCALRTVDPTLLPTLAACQSEREGIEEEVEEVAWREGYQRGKEKQKRGLNKWQTPMKRC